jgi:Flp pilus assembly protein CpaB
MNMRSMGPCAVVLSAFAGVRSGAAMDVVTVVVARQYIPAGTFVTDPEQLFKLVRYVKGDEPQQAVTNRAALMGMVIVRTLAEDQPVKERDYSATAPPRKPLIPPGMRVMTLPVDSGAETIPIQAHANAYVRVQIPGSDEKRDMRLEDVTVLAVTRQPNGADGKPRPPIVTLLMTPDQANELLDAQSAGLVSLRLRRL